MLLDCGYFQAERNQRGLHFGDRLFAVELDVRDYAAGNVRVDQRRRSEPSLQFHRIALGDFDEFLQAKAKVLREWRNHLGLGCGSGGKNGEVPKQGLHQTAREPKSCASKYGMRLGENHGASAAFAALHRPAAQFIIASCN